MRRSYAHALGHSGLQVAGKADQTADLRSRHSHELQKRRLLDPLQRHPQGSASPAWPPVCRGDPLRRLLTLPAQPASMMAARLLAPQRPEPCLTLSPQRRCCASHLRVSCSCGMKHGLQMRSIVPNLWLLARRLRHGVFNLERARDSTVPSDPRWYRAIHCLVLHAARGHHLTSGPKHRTEN